MTDSLQHTPLHDAHVALGAKMVPYAGYEMPVQYPGGILAEHQAVRSGLGVFDVSHMGEFEVTGPDRNAFVNRVTCNDISVLDSGDVQYSAILSDEGTFEDDCTVYRFDDKIMIVVNAANRARAWEHIVDLKKGTNVRLRATPTEQPVSLEADGEVAVPLAVVGTVGDAARHRLAHVARVEWPTL